MMSIGASFASSSRSYRLLVLVLAVAIGYALPAFAQNPVKKGKETSLTEVLKGEANAYRIELQDKEKSVLTIHPEPVLAWVNPVRYQQQGFVYVWTDKGKARAIGGVFSNFFSDEKMYTTHEFHSLAPVGLKATFADKDVWHPADPGVEFIVLKDAPSPAPKKATRLAQMRRLAQSFSAHSITQEGSRYELRLLTAPLFRYKTEESDVYDGAVFSMVTSAGTDPEILLVFEVGDTKEGPAWHYAPARFSDSRLYLQQNEKPVWQFDYPEGVAGYQHEVAPENRYRLWDNRQFTPNEIAQLLKNAKTEADVPSSR